MSVKNQMKEKYQKFCIEFRRTGGNATEAAIRAGYSAKTAAQAGSRLLKNVKVQKYLEELAKDAVKKAIISIDKRQEILSGIALNDEAEDGDRIRAIDVLNKMDGLYIAKVEVSVAGNLAVRLKERSGRYGRK